MEPLVTTCPNCGAVVDQAANERCPECSIPLQVTCANCGAHVPADADDCHACGEPLTHAGDAAI